MAIANARDDRTNPVFKKPNDVAVLIPKSKDLSILARKLYWVLLWETQRQAMKIIEATGQLPSMVHTFECRMGDLFSMIDEDYKDMYSRGIKLFWELQDTKVEFGSAGKDEESRTATTLLAHVTVIKRDKVVIGQWTLPSPIAGPLINSKQYTLIELKQVMKLKSYAAIALYEIFARYKTIPGGCTSSHSPEWWTEVISHKVASRARDWRKVKYETIQPALKEISLLTDFIVEKPEEKRNGPRNSVTEVYFKIKKKSSEAAQEGMLPIELVEMASRLRVALPSVKHVVTEIHHGDRIAKVALERLEAEINKQGPDAIESPTGYFRKIVDSLAIHVSTKPSVKPKAPSSEPELKQSATDEVRRAVTELPREEQLDLLERAVEIMRPKGVFTAQATLKYKAFKEEGGALTPVLLNYMVEVYKSDQIVVQANAEIAE